ncbi:hypothetical protein ENBRE01_1701, partial [Enteropsectra breve]
MIGLVSNGIHLFKFFLLEESVHGLLVIPTMEEVVLKSKEVEPTTEEATPAVEDTNGSDKAKNQVTECGICLEAVYLNDNDTTPIDDNTILSAPLLKYRLLDQNYLRCNDCRVILHKNCLLPALRYNFRCILCRKPLPENLIFTLLFDLLMVFVAKNQTINYFEQISPYFYQKLPPQNVLLDIFFYGGNAEVLSDPIARKEIHMYLITQKYIEEPIKEVLQQTLLKQAECDIITAASLLKITDTTERLQHFISFCDLLPTLGAEEIKNFISAVMESKHLKSIAFFENLLLNSFVFKKLSLCEFETGFESANSFKSITNDASLIDYLKILEAESHFEYFKNTKIHAFDAFILKAANRTNEFDLRLFDVLLEKVLENNKEITDAMKQAGTFQKLLNEKLIKNIGDALNISLWIADNTEYSISAVTNKFMPYIQKYFDVFDRSSKAFKQETLESTINFINENC